MEKARRKLDRNVKQVKRQIREIDEKLKKDVIDLFSLRYTERAGLESEPVELRSEVFSGEIEIPSSPHDQVAEPGFEPGRYEVDGAFVQPVTLLVSPHCTLLALKVGHGDEDYRIKLDWVKKRSQQKSRVYLIDPENSEYYYPNCTDLRGEVVPGSPRTGLVAFDPLRYPTATLEVHFSNVKLIAERGARETFHFVHKDPELPEAIEKHQKMDSLSERLEKLVEQEKQRVWSEVQGSSGCGLLLLFCSGAVAAVAAGVIALI